VLLKGKASTLTGIQYQWFRNDAAVAGATSAGYTATQTGAYKLLQTVSSTGCSIISNEVSVTANAAPVSAIVPLGKTTFCSGSGVVLYGGLAEGKHYYWFNDSSYINVGNVNTLTATESGIYTLTTQDSVTGCSSTSKGLLITVLDLPQPAIVPPAKTALCDGASAILHADKTQLPAGNNSFQWMANGIIIPGATTDSLFVNTGADYTVMVTDEAGCSNTSKVQSMLFNVLPVVKYSFPHTACAGSPVDFINKSYVPKGELTYNWTFGDGTSSTQESPSHAYVAAGKYKMILYATSASGCVSMFMDSIIVHAATKADFKAEHSGPRRFTFTAQDTTGAQYHWIFGDGMTGTGRTADHDYFVDGNYQVILQVTNASGCITILADSISLNSTGLADNSNPGNSFSVYPNPFVQNSNITYTISKQSNVTLEVYDMLGQKVETVCNGLQAAGKYIYTFDGRKQAIPSDIYFVKLRVDENVYIQRLVRVQ
jgi:PKD repeat protein